MVLLNNPITAQKKLAENARLKRLSMELTQAGLAQRSGVPLPTLRKFEQKGVISLESYLKIQMVLGTLENIVNATQLENQPYTSIDDVLNDTPTQLPQRGKRK